MGSSYEHAGDSGDTEETDEDYPSTSGMQNREAIPESHEAIMPQIDQLQNLMAVSENMEGATIPVTFERAIKEIKWKDAMIRELSNITQRNVWEEVKQAELQPNTKRISTKWVYTLKKGKNEVKYKSSFGCARLLSETRN